MRNKFPLYDTLLLDRKQAKQAVAARMSGHFGTFIWCIGWGELVIVGVGKTSNGRDWFPAAAVWYR